MEVRKFPNRVAGLPPVAEAIPTSVAPGKIGPPNVVIPAAAPSMMAEEAATLQKKRKRRKQKEHVEVPVAPSPSPSAPVTSEPEIESPRPLPPETLCPGVDAAVREKKQEQNQAALMGEEEATRLKRRKRRKQKEQVEIPVAPPPSPFPPVAPEPEIESPRPLPPETLCSEVDAAGRGEKQELNQAALMAEEEATRLKKRKRRNQKEEVEAPVVPLSSLRPPVTPEPKLKSRGALASESLSSVVDAAVRGKKQEGNQTVAEGEARRLKKQKRRKQKEQVEVPVALLPSPSPQVTLEPEIEPPRPLPPESLCSVVDAAVPGKRQEQEESQAVAASPLLEPAEETRGKDDKKRKRKKHEEGAASQSQSAIAEAPVVEGEHKMADAVALAPKQGRRKLRLKEQEQSSESPLSFDIHPQVGEAAVNGPKSDSVPVRRSSSRKKPHSPSTREILRMRIETRKQQPLPEGILDFKTIAADPNQSHPVAAFFNQFIYKPDSRQRRNSPPFPKTPDRPARIAPRGHSSSGPSQVTANGTSKAAKTTALNAPVSLSQETVPAKDKEKIVERMVGKDQRKPKPSQLTAAEKRSDMYRRLPLDQLVPPPHSPHNLLQEEYASDPWKVIVICMLLNKTQGIQVRKILLRFFELYPDPHIAYRADPIKMAEHLAPLGLQHIKTRRIQNFSEAYVEKEWTHVTQLCGVGKYAADAYAIFCAGRATEVVPEDHKLVDYWNYVCNELPLLQRSENSQESRINDEQEKVIPKAQELAACC